MIPHLGEPSEARERLGAVATTERRSVFTDCEVGKAAATWVKDDRDSTAFQARGMSGEGRAAAP